MTKEADSSIVRYRLTADTAFYREAFARHFSLQWWRSLMSAIRVLGLLVLAPLVCFAISEGEVGTAILMATFIVVILGGRTFDNWRLLRRVRQSPEFEDVFLGELDDAGLRFHSDRTNYEQDWSLCTRAIEFSDGLLLYFGPQIFRWLPHASLVEGSTAESVIALVRAAVADYGVRD